MPKLTKAEEHLIAHPPNPGTWQCNRKYKRTTVDEVEEHTCASIQTAKHKSCVICQRPRGRQAIDLHPKYLAACSKGGVEPKGVAA